MVDGIASALTDPSKTNEPLEIFCDESGHTGPKLLDPQQRIFSYAAVALTDVEAWSLLNEAREAYPQQMEELKASKLCKTASGRKFVEHVLRGIEGRYSVVVYDKLLALCGKVFEYIYEPVYQDAPQLLYEKNLHRFVAMFCYVFFVGGPDDETGFKGDSEQAIREFEWFMRTLDPDRAPLLFNEGARASEPGKDPFELILQFALGYRDIIVADNANIAVETPDQGKWTLDLAISALFSLCNHWGQTGRPLAITCDDSKPLRAMAHLLDGSANDPIIQRAREVMGNKDLLGWKMASPVAFADSRNHPALQVADIAAGAVNAVIAGRGDPDLRDLAELVFPHLHEHAILPDFDIVDFNRNREAAVNWLMLYEMAKRAQTKADPYEGLHEMYYAAEVSWARGDFQDLVSQSQSD